MPAPAAAQPAPPVDPLDVFDRHAALAAPPEPPHALGPLEATTKARLGEEEPAARKAARDIMDPLRKSMRATLERADMPFAARAAALTAQLRQIAESPDRGTVGARAAEFLLTEDLKRVQADAAITLGKVAEAFQAELDALDQRAQATEAAAGDAAPLVGPMKFALDDVLARLPHVDVDEKLTLLEGVVAPAIRSPLTP